MRTASSSSTSAGTMEGLGLGMLVFQGCCQLNFSVPGSRHKGVLTVRTYTPLSEPKAKQFSPFTCSRPFLTGEEGAEQMHSSNAPVQQSRAEGAQM